MWVNGKNKEGAESEETSGVQSRGRENQVTENPATTTLFIYQRWLHVPCIIVTSECFQGVCSFGCFEVGSCYVAQASLKLAILLPQPPKSWDYRCAPHQICFQVLRLPFNVIFLQILPKGTYPLSFKKKYLFIWSPKPPRITTRTSTWAAVPQIRGHHYEIKFQKAPTYCFFLVLCFQ
jgi:hypothetical protein